MNKSQKPAAPLARPQKPLSDEEKQDLIQRKLGQIKAQVSQSLLITFCQGKGAISPADADQIVDNALNMADRYIKKLDAPEGE